MSIPDWDSEDLFVGVRVEGSWASVSVRQLGRRTVDKTRPLSSSISIVCRPCHGTIGLAW